MNREEIIKLIDEHLSKNTPDSRNEISVKAIEDYIESEIIQSDSNLQFVPDSLERKVYLNVCKTIMYSLKTLFDSANINILNHTITFSVRPKDQVKNQAKDQN